MKLWTSGLEAVLVVLGLILLMPQPGNAIPAFARKFGVKCYTCHTVPPALNKNGYMFKRLGYRMPPDEMDGTKPAPKIAELDKDIKFSITNAIALILQASVTDEKTVADAGNTTSASPVSTCNCGSDGTQQSSSCSSFNLDEAALFVAGAVPETGFSYFGHYELYQGGRTTWSRALASTRAAAPTAATSSRPARCICRRAKERARRCSTTSSPIPPTR